jgi:hypothetical protein
VTHGHGETIIEISASLREKCWKIWDYGILPSNIFKHGDVIHRFNRNLLKMVEKTGISPLKMSTWWLVFFPEKSTKAGFLVFSKV